MTHLHPRSLRSGRGGPCAAWSIHCAFIALVALAVPAAARGDDGTEAVRARVATYQAAYNRHDAAAVAEHWSEEAVYVRESGERVRGRAAIRKVFEEIFAADPELRLRVTVHELRLVTPDVAIEDGAVEITGFGPDLESTYTAVNVKKNGVWYLDSVRETDSPAPPSHHAKLQPLAWMIGEWEGRDDGLTVKSKCEWAKNKNFLVRQFSISGEGVGEVSGTQIVGWDASTGRIKSWMFDSDGGFSEGEWSLEKGRWSIKARVVAADGRKGSAVHVISYVDENRFTWQVVTRELDGEVLPNLDEVTIVRAAGR